MSSDLFVAPAIEELAEQHRGTNVCLLAQGPSAQRGFGGYYCLDDPEKKPWKIWCQNGGWTGHTYSDLGFIMDDLAGLNWDHIKNYTREEVEKYIKEANCPLITSRAYRDFPMLVEFPMGNALEVLPKVNGKLNFNETIHYMLALAIIWGVKKLDIYGADYQTASEKSKFFRPDKRACTEFWLGMCAMAGIQIRTYQGSSLMRYGIHDPATEIEGLYGYGPNNLPQVVADNFELLSPGIARIKVGNG